MIILFVPICIGLLLVASVVVFNVRFPENRYIQAAHSWQSLIGSFIGFVAGAYVLVLGQQIANEQKLQSSKNHEIRLLEIVKSDVETLRNVTSTTLDGFGVGDLKIEDGLQCGNMLNIFKSLPMKSVSISNEIGSLAGSVNPQTFIVLKKPINFTKLYHNSINAITVEDCITNHQRVTDYFRQAMKSLVDGMEISLTDIDGALAYLKK